MNINKPQYSVIVPVYNSQATLEELVERIEAVMQRYESYELLLIDDFSTDGSWEQLISIKNNRDHIRLLRLTRNFGQAAVTLCGIREAKADILITIDDDLQYPPEEIPKLIESFNPKEKYIVFGVPIQKQDKPWNKITSYLIDIFINRVLLHRSRNSVIKFSTFKILTKKIYRREVYNESSMRSLQVFFNMVSPQLMDYVYIRHEQRKKGKSNYSFLKKLRISLELIMVTTDLPFYLFLALFAVSAIVAFIAILPGYFVQPVRTEKLYLPLISGAFSLTFLGFVLVFTYIKKLYTGYHGEEEYAIWEEA